MHLALFKYDVYLLITLRTLLSLSDIFPSFSSVFSFALPNFMDKLIRSSPISFVAMFPLLDLFLEVQLPLRQSK